MTSQSDLKQEFETLGTTLADTTADWKQRVDGLKRIRGLLLGGATNLQNFVPVTKDHLKEALNAQVLPTTLLCLQCHCPLCPLTLKKLVDEVHESADGEVVDEGRGSDDRILRYLSSCS